MKNTNKLQKNSFNFSIRSYLKTILGGCLIAASFISALVISNSSSRMITVWSAAVDLDKGEVITAEDVVISKVLLPGNAGNYIDGQVSIIGSSVVRAIGIDELIPAYALSSQVDEQLQQVPIAIAFSQVPKDIGSGQRVDIYGITKSELRSQSLESGRYKSRLIASDLVIDQVDNQANTLGGDLVITLLVPRPIIPNLIEDMGNYDFILVGNR
ncbi:MAG: flagella basal body P-ring formation protein FlgA [Acidobacteria bacterium]|nr:flagella basal body P-ring formation protein FlgA [Acidobacteriota bacterium]